jgi:hypothetical protein
VSELPGSTAVAGNSDRRRGRPKGWLRRSVAVIVAVGVVAVPLTHDAIPHEHPALVPALRTGVAEAAVSLAGQPCPPELHDASRWHLPYDPRTGCVYGHEHGDAPPQWITDAGYTVAFDQHSGFHGNTSSIENTTKHAAMKGFLADFSDYAGGTQQVYFRVHIASNVLDRMARYHSYEVYMRDAAGGVSHWQGWFNGGDPAKDRVVYDGTNPKGSTFYATQFGELVSGPTAARCSGTTTIYGATYQNQCLPQYIATTARAVEHTVPDGNARERVFPGIGLGVRLPN